MTKITTYSFCELAGLYFPKASPTCAPKQLRRWINNNPQLKKSLTDSGYYEKQRYLTPRQVGLIFDLIGEP